MAQIVDMAVGDFQIGDLFAGKIGRKPFLPKLMFRVPSVSLCNERARGEQWAAQPRTAGASQGPGREAKRELQQELAAASAAL
jgi:hypothetical protein